MAVLSKNTMFDPVLVSDLITKVQGKSSLAALSAQVPIPFNGMKQFTFNMDNEIDIVAEKDNRIIVVEVKSRSHPIYDISQVITRDKIRHLINAGNAYVKMFNLPHELQFDVILMVGQDPDNFTVEHIPDAFMAPLRTY